MKGVILLLVTFFVTATVPAVAEEADYPGRALFRDVLEEAIPVTLQDVVLVFATVTGSRGGRLTQESYANKIYSQDINGQRWSAIQVTTAAGICTAVDLMGDGKLPNTGFVRQEDITLADFLANRFGRYYNTAN